MVINNQSLTVNISKDSIREMESFIDKVCDQLFINETYYGNLLVSMTEVLSLLAESDQNGEKLEIVYNSDYSTIKFTLSPIAEEICLRLLSPISIDNLSNEESDKNFFLIYSTVDNITMNNIGQLIFEYDISALHKEIYEERKKHLLSYFKVAKKENTTVEN